MSKYALKCPNCGSPSRLSVTAVTQVEIDCEGNPRSALPIAPKELDWYRDSYTICTACDFAAQLRDFIVEPAVTLVLTKDEAVLMAQLLEAPLWDALDNPHAKPLATKVYGADHPMLAPAEENTDGC